jgi:hypothetical protein
MTLDNALSRQFKDSAELLGYHGPLLSHPQKADTNANSDPI